MHEDDATLPEIATAPATGAKRSEGPRPEPQIDARYELGPVLGRGGMGEVRLARDTRIDREVAVKLMAGRAEPDTTARFFREARVQGALEHPAVVPVHDLGIDAHGQPYFVMKRLAGTTLLDVLAARGSSDRAGETWSRRLLLTRLVDVCLAIELAHTRGIVHRDLKPANIMLGDYGEAYVLDWGLARVLDARDPAIGATAPPEEAGHTAAGALLGTPGYMAPEQARGEPVDARTDVFSLGCILYEILAGAAALPRGMPALAVTLEAAEHRPSKRVAEIPPELDDLCARATAQDPAARLTARGLADGIQRYLDGDRDLERRRELATEHVTRARAALGAGPDAGDEARATAMREAGRAFALDPANAAAQELLAGLVLAAPARLSAGAAAAAERARSHVLQRALRWAAFTYAVVALLGLSLFAFPVRAAWPILLSAAACAGLAALLWAAARVLRPTRSPWFVAILLGNTVVLICGAFVFGPLLIVPIYITGSLAGFVSAPARHHPALIIVLHLIAIAIPFVLEATGITPATFYLEHGRIVLAPYAVELSPAMAIAIIVTGTLSQFANTSVIGLAQRRGLEGALDQVHAQSWHLKQLLPHAGEPPRG